MSCPTCDGTMHSISVPLPKAARVYVPSHIHVEQDHLFFCPRCGTVKTKDGETHVPRLVERVREFIATGKATYKDESLTVFLELLQMIGVLEAAFTPDDRREYIR